MQRKQLTPGRSTEIAIRVFNQAMNYSGSPYWLSFGGLWAIIRNSGIIPDGDFDLCTYYGADYQRIQKAFKGVPGRYEMTKAIVSDVDKTKALYCSYSSSEGLPHICLSFWYLHEGIRYYCHDQHHEVEGVGVPRSGYFFRGCPAEHVEDNPNNFRMVEWPGINQQIKVRVPRFPGVMLDNLYPDWAYKKQHYEVGKGLIDEERMVSYHKGGAVSSYAVHVQGMNDWNNQGHVRQELEKSKAAWLIRLKTGK